MVFYCLAQTASPCYVPSAQGPLEDQVTAELVSFLSRCRVVRLLFGSVFFLQSSLFVPSIEWQGFERNCVGAGSVRLKIITEKS